MKESQFSEAEQQDTPSAHRAEGTQTAFAKAYPLRDHKHILSRKTQEILLYIYGVIAVLLLSRFLLSLIGARHIAPFVEFVYDLSTPIMIPFSNIFGILQSGPYTLEFDVLIALLIYAAIFFGVARLVSIVFD